MITDRLGAVGAYAALSAALDHADAARAKFQADVQGRVAALATGVLFLTLELNRLDDDEVEAALAAHPKAERWRPWLRRVRLERPHELSEELERYLLDRAPALAQWSRLYDETIARLVVEARGEKLTLAQAMNRLSDPKPDRRKAAAKGLDKALAEAAPIAALCLNALAMEKQVEDRWRRFATPAASRHLLNEVDAEAVEAMISAVVEACPRLSHRYYRLKAKALGKSALDHWDRNAPVETRAPKSYGWDQARTLVLDAFSDLGPGFSDRAERFFVKPWIDARPRPGKAPGAFCHPVTAERHPYVLVNFMGERRDVLTLAHELGHAVHQSLAAPRGTLIADTPLTLAETASIFAEGLAFERLYAEAEPRERRGLLAGRIEDGLNAVVRQAGFHRLETRFHTARAEGEVPVETLGQLWLETAAETLGPAVTLNPGYESYWAAVSHLIHTPFYVYAYAFGDLLVSALMQKRLADPEGFALLYAELLAGGGARTYVEALKPFGLDPRSPEFWRAGLQRLEGLVDRFEQLP
jgi:oligoendopeptidase F